MRSWSGPGSCRDRKLNSFHLETPSPLGECVRIRGKAVIPAEAGIQALEIIIFSDCLDARFRGHDELEPSTIRGKGKTGLSDGH